MATITSPLALECRECHSRYPVEPLTICEECFGPLEPAYDLSAIDGLDFRKHVEAGPGPPLGSGAPPPPAKAPRRPEGPGRRSLWIKDDSVNPSNSFKDRVVAIAATMARAFGFEAISCASTGNLANATAAHAAKVGMPAYVFCPDDLEVAKLLATG